LPQFFFMYTPTQTQIARRYEVVPEEKSGGATYTPKNLSDFVAEQIIACVDSNKLKQPLRVLDPAVGDGMLLVSLLEQLTKVHCSTIEVFGFDTNENAVKYASRQLQQLFPNISFHLETGNFLEFVVDHFGASDNSDLFKSSVIGAFDIIIANPPYVRTQILGAKQANLLARQYGLSGRIDLYYAFLLGMGKVLTPGGIAGIIVSNRFMTTKSGRAVRRNILDQFKVLHVWDMGDTRFFEAAVLPAVLLLAGMRKDGNSVNHKPHFTSIYSTDEASKKCASDPIAALRESGVVEVSDGRRFLIQHGLLDHGNKAEGVWRIATENSDRWLLCVKAHTWSTFSRVGKIRVGVKTTADKVFIRSDWDDLPEDERPELLRPLTTHHGARRFKYAQPQTLKQIIYPHQMVHSRRCTIDLSEYPRAAAYFNRHKTTLESREYVIEAGRKWYEIWVPHNPDDWAKPKIVFRDISEKPTFWMDLEGTVVNGDCYWLTCNDESQIDWLWLSLAVGNSTFIEAFYDHRFNNKLYAGRRRFITQYVEKFPLPDPDTALAKSIIEMTKRIYTLVPSAEADALDKVLDGLIWQAFGLSAKKAVG